MALMLAQKFPFLTAVLPPIRKAWMSEHYRTSMFSAIAIAVAGSGYWRKTNNSEARNLNGEPRSAAMCRRFS